MQLAIGLPKTRERISSQLCKYQDVATQGPHTANTNFLEGLAHYTLLISEHQASSVSWLKLALSYYYHNIFAIKQICMHYHISCQSIFLWG